MRGRWHAPVLIWVLCWALLMSLVWVARSDAGADSLAGFPESNLRSSSQKEDRRGADDWWARDKRLHLLVSAGLVGVGYHLVHDRWNRQAESSRGIAIGVTTLAGVLKELSDSRKTPPTCSYKDLVADGVGILAGILIFTR